MLALCYEATKVTVVIAINSQCYVNRIACLPEEWGKFKEGGIHRRYQIL